MNQNLEGKVVIVTGGGSGIGRAMALEFADAGANLVVCDINIESAKAVAEEVKNKNRLAQATKADETRWDEVTELARKTVDRFNRIDGPVNNAGTTD